MKAVGLVVLVLLHKSNISNPSSISTRAASSQPFVFVRTFIYFRGFSCQLVFSYYFIGTNISEVWIETSIFLGGICTYGRNLASRLSTNHFKCIYHIKRIVPKKINFSCIKIRSTNIGTGIFLQFGQKLQCFFFFLVEYVDMDVI